MKNLKIEQVKRYFDETNFDGKRADAALKLVNAVLKKENQNFSLDELYSIDRYYFLWTLEHISLSVKGAKMFWKFFHRHPGDLRLIRKVSKDWLVERKENREKILSNVKDSLQKAVIKDNRDLSDVFDIYFYLISIDALNNDKELCWIFEDLFDMVKGDFNTSEIIGWGLFGKYDIGTITHLCSHFELNKTHKAPNALSWIARRYETELSSEEAEIRREAYFSKIMNWAFGEEFDGAFNCNRVSTLAEFLELMYILCFTDVKTEEIYKRFQQVYYEKEYPRDEKALPLLLKIVQKIVQRGDLPAANFIELQRFLTPNDEAFKNDEREFLPIEKDILKTILEIDYPTRNFGDGYPRISLIRPYYRLMEVELSEQEEKKFYETIKKIIKENKVKLKYLSRLEYCRPFVNIDHLAFYLKCCLEENGYPDVVLKEFLKANIRLNISPESLYGYEGLEEFNGLWERKLEYQADVSAVKAALNL